MDEQEIRNYQILLNNRPIDDFENYSPNEMNYILYDTFHKNSVIAFQDNPSKETLKQIPFLLQVKYLLKTIDQLGEIKLTGKGFLPTKIVADIYKQGFIKDKHIESGLYKLYKETDSNIVYLTRIISELAKLVKKNKGKLTLTKKGEKLLDEKKEFELFKTIFLAFLEQFNWSFFDLFEDEQVGQLGLGFSLILLEKYGDKYRDTSFYTNKYLKAFPFFRENFTPSYGTIDDKVNHCYSTRTFERFLKYFWLVEINYGEGILDNFEVKKTEIFDKLFKIEKV